MSNESFIIDTNEQTNTVKGKADALEIDTQTDTNKPKRHPFHWLNIWIMYTPMITIWTIKNGKMTKRNDIGYKICLIFLILLVIGWSIWYPYTTVSRRGITLYTMVYLASFACHSIGKFSSIYYFWKYFKLYGSDNIRQAGFTLQENHKLIKRINIRMKIILCVAIFCLLTIKSIAFVQMVQSADTETMDWIYLMRSFITYYVFDIPLYLTQFILSIDYLEGRIFITDLHTTLDKTGKIDFGSAITEYNKYRNEFKEKIKFLEYYLKCRLLSQILFIWVSITGIGEAESFTEGFVDVLYLILVTLPFIELVFSGSTATTSFHKFKKKIYAIGIEINYENFFTDSDNHIQHNLYLYLLQYVTNYPFLIKIFAKEVSIKNFIKVCAAFACAKVATYLFNIHVN